jgi:PAS domain S-box-containing protein
MLSANADAAHFWSDALRRVGLPPGWTASVHDRRGIILARQPDPERHVGQPVHPDALAAVQEAPEGVQEGWAPGTARDGRPVYLAWHRVPSLPWTVLVGVPGEVVDGLVRRSLLPVMGGGAAVVLGLSLLLALWGTRRIARPLAALERAAAAAGRGEVPAPPDAPSGLRELDAAIAALGAAAAERRERESEGAALAARLALVLESTTDSIVMVDGAWCVTYVNGRARQMLARGGGPGSLLLGTRLWDAFPASLGGPFEAAWRRAMRERLPQSVTGYHAALGLWVTADAFPAGGGLTIFFRDVSAAKLAEAALRDSEARLKAVLEHVPVGVLLAEAPSGRLLLGNRQAEEILGRPVRFGAGVAAGAAFDAAALGEAAGGAEAFPLARTLATGAHAQGELRLRRADGGLVWIRAWSAPIRDATGRVTGAVAAFADIGAERESATALQRQVAAEAAARQAAIAAAEALAESEERFRRFGEASPDGLWIGDPTGRRLDYASPAFERLWGATQAALAADPGLWLARVHPDDRARAAEAIAQAAAGETLDIEYRLLRNGGGGDGADLRWIRDIVFPIRDAAGRVTRVGRLLRDVTPRKEWEERQALLMAELNHRVKNTLATVQSLAQQTARGAVAAEGPDRPPLERYLGDFQARLMALARGHDLLTARTWRGAALDEVVLAALAPWRSADGGQQPQPTRFQIEGPPIWLEPRQALALALALHELATNAAKHGALSRPEGRVVARWQHDRQDGMTTLTWQEQGGPTVRAPARRGFGTRLLQRGLSAELGRDATVSLRYDAAGFGATIRFRAAAPPAGADGGGHA